MQQVQQTERFEQFLQQLQETNLTLDAICDFNKIESNVAEIKLSLCVLNSLIGAQNLTDAVQLIWERDKHAFEVLDILVAIRRKDNKAVLDRQGNLKKISHYFENTTQIIQFLEETGLAEVLQQQKVKDLVDYVFGVETGMDTNARKNRVGKTMQNFIAQHMTNLGLSFRQEVESKEWPQLKEVLGDDLKRFDFVVTTQQKTYLFEVNFYSSGGSKLNEIARSYTDIAPKVNAVPGLEFVWVTDGQGWYSAKNKLQEAFKFVPHIYNLSTIETFLQSLKEQQ
ncbi:MAG: type II restriction endonuclease [Bacteroidales bacterium]|nr:type II restriction endonuclease [Bacteroidales bacterium]